MKTGIIIVNYNDFLNTSNLINNISDYKVIDKIVVVDNKSKDDSVNRLKELKNKKLHIIESSSNKGYASAINLGAKYLKKELGDCNIIVSNSDIIIDKEKDLKELIKHLDKKDIGLVGPTILEINKLNRGWKMPSPKMDALMNLPGIHRLIRKNFVNYKEEHYDSDVSLVDVVSGCMFLIKAKTLEEIKYLDENTFLYYEENILARKLKIKKKNVLIDNNVIVIHNHSKTIDRNVKKIAKLKMQKKSQYYFQTEYNDATKFEKFLLKLTAGISIFILGIYYKFKK